MTAITFDTLKFANKLKNAGVPQKQAEAEAEALAEVFEANLKDLASKGDIKELELKVGGEIKLLKWMIGFGLAGTLAIVMMMLRLFTMLPSS